MSAKTLWDLLKKTVEEWWNDNTFRLAASLAFYTIFSIAPVLLLAVALGSLIFGEQETVERVVRELEGLMGHEGAAAANDMMGQLERIKASPWAAAFGIVMLVIGSTVVFAELQAALNLIWDVKAEPKHGMIWSVLRVRLRSFAIALGVAFLLLVSLVVSAGLSAAQDYLSARLGGVAWLWQAANILVSFLVATLLFAMIYKYLPDVKIIWRDVIIGAVVTAILFTVGKFLIGLYLGQAAMGGAYGAAGSFVVLLLWVYYSGLISFFGAEFTQVYARRYGSMIRPEKHAERVGEKSDSV